MIKNMNKNQDVVKTLYKIIAVEFVLLLAISLLHNKFETIASYGFFNGPHELSEQGYKGEDLMSSTQFIVMGTIFLFIIAISIYLRRVGKEKLFKIYKTLAIGMPILEVFKISFSTYYDLSYGEPFNLGGILPLYTCSMLLYFLPCVVWGKGRLQKVSMAFFASIGMVAGLTNFIYLSAASWYPIFTFGGLYSVIFHAVLVFVGMSLLITEQYTPSWHTIVEGMTPVVLFSMIVIPANFIIKAIPSYAYVDYTLLMSANGFVPTITNFFITHHIQLLFSLLMLFVIYPLATALIVLIEVSVKKVIESWPKLDKTVLTRQYKRLFK